MTSQDRAGDVADILKFLAAGERLGVVLPAHLRDKLDSLGRAGAGRLKVALAGGFSEGKTSLAAAWLGMLPDDMKISQSESSNAVTVYDAGDEVDLIDTPGLFGFKETTLDDGTVEKYKEMTRKYVSEADLLLYVLNPSNPVKESHKEELNWLFRDLGLLARTVFVIGRFDLVADVEDEEDYAHHLNIKQASIKARLKALVGLTGKEEAALSIVGVAANPFDRGIPGWLERPEEYARLSHIGALRYATAEKVKAVGGAEEAKRQTCVAILTDVTDRLLLPTRQAAEESAREAEIADGKAKEEQPRLARYQREAAQAQMALRLEVVDYFGDLITEANSTDMENFAAFFDRKIGADGVVMQTMMTNAFMRELGPISQQLVTMSADFAAASGSAMTGVLGKVAKRAKGVNVSNTMILKARDWVMPAFKFKPYGAIKAARFANGALAGIGLALELWSVWQDAQKAEKFAKDRQAIVDDLQGQRAALLAQIDAPDFLDVYFPQIDAMRSLFAELAAAFVAAVERNREMRDWAAEADSLRRRFDHEPSRPAITIDMEDIIA